MVRAVNACHARSDRLPVARVKRAICIDEVEAIRAGRERRASVDEGLQERTQGVKDRAGYSDPFNSREVRAQQIVLA